MVFTLVLTPLFIRLFNLLGWGQFIRDDGPQTHHTKRGTPTMGGIVFLVGGFLGYLLFHKDADDGFLQPAGLIGSLIGAIIVLLIWVRVGGRRSITH